MTTITPIVPQTPIDGLPWRPSDTVAPIRILTVDEHPLVREGLASIISREPGLLVVAEAGTGAAALERCRHYRPDVVTLDLLLPDMSGAEAATRILAELPRTRIIAVTGAQGDVDLVSALEAGISGVVLKRMPPGELPAMIRQVAAGRKVIPQQVASLMAEHFGDEALTPREVQVLRLVAWGNGNKQVAAALTIADETVRMHMRNIFGKLGASDRTHAVTIALTRGVFQLRDSPAITR